MKVMEITLMTINRAPSVDSMEYGSRSGQTLDMSMITKYFAVYRFVKKLY